ncbi:hypothetical protein I3843_02G129200 [Carya illinoinensis]|uniref:FLZ-type domain-containing protein n=1 Tax=Carya illinoinensis TaxID=32201 RepID=A0A922K626_CARIL|nr:hypothetical protein I3842_02G148400 [Carya illinoinensis]KAG6727928.1 hypothetical protein I3842_02G148400 [Carya illinoinensis]KAG7992462.1 hypothetical protein I3843_02G129200 [Carya illinoinensis]KAG7992464.1 hypothetical protein I3843_02G129200 [Carya illinoinensis]
MADSTPESLQSDTLGPRHISSSLFSIPGFIVGFGTKCLSESDSVRSPTSPLDLKAFPKLNSPFGHKSPRTQSHQSGHKKKWDCSKVGLGIINSLVNETKPSADVLDSPRKNVIFGPQVKTKPNHESLYSSVKSNSLPKNYIFSSLLETKTLNPQLGGTNVTFDIEGISLESGQTKTVASCLLDPTSSSSLDCGLTQNHSLSFMNFCSENKTSIASSPLILNRGSQVANSLDNKPSSLPIPIGASHGILSSFSAREIELSEDYTCIISHGPNPKTTHIFGDCILDCHMNELADFGKKDGSGSKSLQEAETLKRLIPFHSEETFSFCYLCKKILQEGEDIYIYRGEKAFCSFECRAEVIFAEESEETCNNSAEISPGSSYHEDLFLMGMPFAT